MRHLVATRVFDRPRWMTAVERAPPLELQNLHINRREVINPFPSMLHELLLKYPDMRFQDCYVDGNDWAKGTDLYRDDHPAMQFVSHQLDVMRRGFTRKMAFQITEKLFYDRRLRGEREQKLHMALASFHKVSPMYNTGQAYLINQIALKRLKDFGMIRNNLRDLRHAQEKRFGIVRPVYRNVRNLVGRETRIAAFSRQHITKDVQDRTKVERILQMIVNDDKSMFFFGDLSSERSLLGSKADNLINSVDDRKLFPQSHLAIEASAPTSLYPQQHPLLPPNFLPSTDSLSTSRKRIYHIPSQTPYKTLPSDALEMLDPLSPSSSPSSSRLRVNDAQSTIPTPSYFSTEYLYELNKEGPSGFIADNEEGKRMEETLIEFNDLIDKGGLGWEMLPTVKLFGSRMLSQEFSSWCFVSQRLTQWLAQQNPPIKHFPPPSIVLGGREERRFNRWELDGDRPEGEKRTVDEDPFDDLIEEVAQERGKKTYISPQSGEGGERGKIGEEKRNVAGTLKLGFVEGIGGRKITGVAVKEEDFRDMSEYNPSHLIGRLMNSPNFLKNLKNQVNALLSTNEDFFSSFSLCRLYFGYHLRSCLSSSLSSISSPPQCKQLKGEGSGFQKSGSRTTILANLHTAFKKATAKVLGCLDREIEYLEGYVTQEGKESILALIRSSPPPPSNVTFEIPPPPPQPLPKYWGLGPLKYTFMKQRQSRLKSRPVPPVPPPILSTEEEEGLGDDGRKRWESDDEFKRQQLEAVDNLLLSLKPSTRSIISNLAADYRMEYISRAPTLTSVEDLQEEWKELFNPLKYKKQNKESKSRYRRDGGKKGEGEASRPAKQERTEGGISENGSEDDDIKRAVVSIDSRMRRIQGTNKGKGGKTGKE